MPYSRLKEHLQTRFRSYFILVLLRRIVVWSVQRGQQSHTRKGKKALNLDHKLKWCMQYFDEGFEGSFIRSFSEKFFLHRNTSTEKLFDH